MVPAAVLTWIPVVLLLDRGASMTQQRLLGVGTWLLLLALLWRKDSRTRAQVAVVVAFATAVEYCFAGWLGVYVYRLHDVPWFVPPGHGLVYLGALAIGRSAYAAKHARWLVPATLTVGGGYALWGLALSGRRDVLGAFWFACLVFFLVRGRRRSNARTPTGQNLVFVGAFVVVTYLELLGTSLGTWTWQVRDPILGIVAMGNPPSGAAGGYGFFDAAALAFAPRLLALLARIKLPVPAWSVGRLGPRGERAQDLLVQQPVRAHHAAAVGTGDA
ncbi:MAG TPA: hypothetical protein VFT62_06595 [Mycobacteriales bacterium]|nr:hypothetical protein [Mycobacteriales bacterium]